MIFENASFRDPAGRIFYLDNKVFRKIEKEGEERLSFFSKNNLMQSCIEQGFLIDSKILTKEEKIKERIDLDSTVVEHMKIPFISYPYEWSFYQLKSAALHHLDFHIYLLNNEATLIDASAYNIQFIGYKPVFIDLLSIKKYEEGEYWTGHKQFCENFLNPLILTSKKGIPFKE